MALGTNNLGATLRSTRSMAMNALGLTPDAVFIWIPKSAGTSLFDSLSDEGCQKLKSLELVKKRFSQRGLVTFGHMDYRGLIDAGYISSAFDERAKKFALTRDPYARAVSLYLYIRDRHKMFEGWRKTPSFREFLEMIDRGHYDSIGLYNVRGLSQANPQVAWTKGIVFDHLGRVESLEESLEAISRLLGKSLQSPKWLNKGSGEDSSNLLDRDTRYLIDKIYDEDFETFGYSKHG